MVPAGWPITGVQKSDWISKLRLVQRFGASPSWWWGASWCQARSDRGSARLHFALPPRVPGFVFGRQSGTPAMSARCSCKPTFSFFKLNKQRPETQQTPDVCLFLRFNFWLSLHARKFPSGEDCLLLPVALRTSPGHKH